MQTILARFRVQPGKEADAEEAIRSMAASVQSEEPGALTHILHRNRKDAAEITVLEIYADDAAFAAHRETQHMSKFGSHFGTLFDPGSVKIDRLERIAGFSR